MVTVEVCYSDLCLKNPLGGPARKKRGTILEGVGDPDQQGEVGLFHTWQWEGTCELIHLGSTWHTLVLP